MPFVNAMIHYIWATKNREKIILSGIKDILLEHIKVNARNHNIYIDTLNCVSDHIHLLISLGTEQTLSKIANLIKGESSHWINKQTLLKNKFEWQSDYIALSVSKSAVPKVREYILNQETHHHKVSFQQEYDSVLKIIERKNILG